MIDEADTFLGENEELRKAIAAEGRDELGRKRCISLERPANIGAALDFGEEICQGRRAESVQPGDNIFSPGAVTSLKFGEGFDRVLTVHAAKQ
ncbi:MAG: hypothetical protein ACR2KT_03115 [Methylocella sp.]